MSETPDTLFVQDMNCSPRHLKRQHEIPMIDGTVGLYDFKHGETLELAHGIAMRFSRDEAFRITDHDGNIFDPAPKLVDQSLPVQVEVDQCIANYDELTQAALLRRAAVEIGGENMNTRTSKKEMIAFLTELARVRQSDPDAAKSGRDLAKPDPGPELPGEELNQMFGDRAA